MRERNINELEAEHQHLLDAIEDSARETDDASIADGHDESTRIALRRTFEDLQAHSNELIQRRVTRRVTRSRSSVGISG
jgi:hypothetical protein